MADSYTVTSTMPFWEHPALFVYTTIGNLLLYRVAHAANTSLWHWFGVNYISIFEFRHDIKPNFLFMLDSATSQLVLLFLNLLLFFEFNVNRVTTLAQYGHNATMFLTNGFPVLLIATALYYELHDLYRYRVYSNKTSRGLFSTAVLYRCLSFFWAHSRVSFHESYVANLLTTFTKVYSDLLHALCWILSGGFLQGGQTVDAYGSAYMSCTAIEWDAIICAVQIIPQILRMLQQLHGYADTKLSQYLTNTFKYVLTVVVILYGLFEQTYTGAYLALSIALALFKAVWDVYVNWGLFEVVPTAAEMWTYATSSATSFTGCATAASGCFDTSSNSNSSTAKHWFLRKELMFHSPVFYYFAIVVNFALRFLWVMSLFPSHTFLGTRLSLFFASMEIVRRSLWGLLRVEFEHVKFNRRDLPGEAY